MEAVPAASSTRASGIAVFGTAGATGAAANCAPGPEAARLTVLELNSGRFVERAVRAGDEVRLTLSYAVTIRL
jgi:hypothetical protein